MKKANEILETHADEKLLKVLGKDVKEEMDTLGDSELKNLIVNSLESMSEAAEKLARNPTYQDLARRLNDVTQGKKDVDKYQKAKITYARRRLREMGKLGVEEREDLGYALQRAKGELQGARAARKDPPNPRCKECGQHLREAAQKGEASRLECYRCDTLPREHTKATDKAA